MYNTGQTAVFIKDLSGKEYPAIAEVNRRKRVNGQRELSLSFLYAEINKEFMDQLEFGWKVLFDGEWYTITHPGYSTDGDFFAVNVTAILSFFVDLNGYYLQDKAENRSITPAEYFSSLFQGTPYSYVLVGNFKANTLNYEDNQSKTERFLYGIDRFNAEYKVQGKVAYLYEQIGSDKDVILHEDLNVNSVRIDVDASGFHTWAKGFGDLPEESESDQEAEYQLEVEYISPLAGKYGMIEGPSVKDGKFVHADALTEAVKKQVENSYLISTEIEAVDLSNNGYLEMVLEEGDRVWLYVSKLNLNQQVRVMEIDEYFDWEGNIIDARYTVGNEGIASRYKTQQYDTLKDFKDILSGRKKIGYDWLPEAIKRAAEIINGNQDSLFQYRAGEIIGINQNNPDGYMRFNTDGIGFSRDGGKTYQTAITYEGIVANAITAGQLNTNNVTVGNNKVQLNDQGIFVYRNNVLGASLVEGNLTFNDQSNGQRIGRFAATVWSDNSTKGISMNMEQNRYISFGHYIDELSGYSPMILLNPSDNMAGNAKGIHMNLPIRMNDDVWMGTKSLRFGENNTHNHSGLWHGLDDSLIVAGYTGVRLAHLSTGGVIEDRLTVDENSVDAWQDLDMHGWKILRVAEVQTSSSMMLKTNIENLTVSGLDIINNLEMKQYILQSDVDAGVYDNWQVGVISEISPEIATPDGLSVNLYKFVSYEAKAIQELSQKLSSLENRVNDLENII